MNYNYYIHKNTYINNKQGLKDGVRIEKIPSIYLIKYKEAEGPFKNLETLKKNSEIYRNLLLTNPKRAQQICFENNISLIKDFVFTNEDFFTDKNFIEIIEHCIKGRIKNGKITGIHYYNPEKMKILNITKENLLNGTWEAEIEFYNLKTNKWIRKDKPTTFFPMNWSIHDLFHECFYAVTNKQKKENRKNIYVSKTKTGIDVEIICSNSVLKSIYPIL